MPSISEQKLLKSNRVYYILHRDHLTIDCVRVEVVKYGEGQVKTNRGSILFARYVWALTEAEILHHRTRLEEARNHEH